MIARTLFPVLVSASQRKKIIVLIGARQVGKTTLLSQFLTGDKKNLLLNCDDLDDKLALEERSSTELKALIDGYDVVLIDEAQRVKNIGITLKKIADLHLNASIFVTGSSAFDLSNTINEPATGRLLEYHLYPLSIHELVEDTSLREERRMLEQRMIFGLYPTVINESAFAKKSLMSLTNNYLYKDILNYKGIKKPEMLQKLVRLLAFQIGSEVNYNELGNTLGMDKETVENYIGLLEKCYIVFRLDSFSRNMRNEIKKGKKVYFYDNGIRNAIINNFSPLALRNDAGALWENLMVSERVKRNAYQENYAQLYFWRTHDQQEIDLVEEMDGQIHTFEFKYSNNKKTSLPDSFAKAYGNATFNIINPGNFQDFIS